MPDTAVNIVEAHQWRLRAAPGEVRHLRRAVPLPGAANAGAIVERVSNAAQVDAVMRHQLVRILTVTIQDWIRK